MWSRYWKTARQWRIQWVEREKLLQCSTGLLTRRQDFFQFHICHVSNGYNRICLLDSVCQLHDRMLIAVSAVPSMYTLNTSEIVFVLMVAIVLMSPGPKWWVELGYPEREKNVPSGALWGKRAVNLMAGRGTKKMWVPCLLADDLEETQKGFCSHLEALNLFFGLHLCWDSLWYCEPASWLVPIFSPSSFLLTSNAGYRIWTALQFHKMRSTCAAWRSRLNCFPVLSRNEPCLK